MREYTARKDTMCSECLATISKGEKYIGNSTSAFHIEPNCFADHNNKKALKLL